jgi:hypothetical protein
VNIAVHAHNIEIVCSSLARKEVRDMQMSSMHALLCTRPRRLGILQCFTKHTLRRLQKGTNIMLRDIDVCLVCTPALLTKTLLDAHKYTDNE